MLLSNTHDKSKVVLGYVVSYISSANVCYAACCRRRGRYPLFRYKKKKQTTNNIKQQQQQQQQ